MPAIGQAAELAGIADESTGVKANRGCIGVNKWNMATDRPGVFAGGDAIGEEATVVWAMRTGAKAAMEIDKYLGGDGVMIEKVRRDAKISSIAVEMKDEIEVRERGKQDMLAYARRKGASAKPNSASRRRSPSMRQAAACIVTTASMIRNRDHHRPERQTFRPVLERKCLSVMGGASGEETWESYTNSLRTCTFTRHSLPAQAIRRLRPTSLLRRLKTACR